MAKKIVKKRKLRVFRLLLILLVLSGLFFGVYNYLKLPINNLIVIGNEYLDDDYILKLAGVTNYPSFWMSNMYKREKKLKTSSYISDAKIKRGLHRTLTIKIEENRALFIKDSDQKVVFADEQEINGRDDFTFRVPRLLNYVPDKKYKKFVAGMSEINSDILAKISDIEYVPNDLDKDRFLLYMDDGNMVYLTLTKFNMINYYNDVLGQLEGRRGILYLDNGNHFQIKE